MSSPLEPIPADLTGQTAVVTGATSGIGKEAAYGLARLGAHVVLVGRSEARLRATIDELAARGVPADRCSTGIADLGRTTEVRALAAALAARHPRLDVLLNNAGCYPGARVITPEGFEEGWATNVLAYELMTRGLLEPIKAARGRVVYVASTMAGDLDLDDLTFARRRWSGIRAYRQSKQANRMLAWAWERKLAGTGVTINVAHPGGVATNIHHRQRGVWGLLNRIAFATQRTPTRGADTPLWLAASPEVADTSGRFYKDRRTLHCRWKADRDPIDRLWATVEEQLA